MNAQQHALAQQRESNVVRPCGYSRSECGYCKGKRCHVIPEQQQQTPQSCSKTYGLLVDRIEPLVYEQFLYRGWRRSGTLLYKPCNWESCCPTVTIRLPVSSFRPTRSQRKLSRRMDALFLPSAAKQTSRALPAKQPRSRQTKQKAQRLLAVATSAGIVPHFESMVHDIIRKQLCPFVTDAPRPSFTIKPTALAAATSSHGSHHNASSPTLPTEFTLITPVCAVIAGKHSSDAHKLDRSTLAKQLSDAMQQRQQASQHQHPPLVQTLSVTHHLGSGQLMIQLKVVDESRWNALCTPNNDANGDQPRSTRNGGSFGQTENGANMNASSHDPMDVSISHDDLMRPDKLAAWYVQVTNGKLLTKEQRERGVVIQTLPAHESALDTDVHRLYAMYQHVVHNDPDPFVAPKKDSPSNNNAMDSAKETPNVDIAELIQKLEWGASPPPQFVPKVRAMLSTYLGSYPSDVQRSVLKNFHSFFQFLVESPMPKFHRQQQQQQQQQQQRHGQTQPMNAHSQNGAGNGNHRYRHGTYHQHYRVGEVLIAVGVVDILPNGLSSVYLFYHPSFSHDLVALGKWTTLQEIQFTNQTLKVPYYYLGYYIESCPKMRYKADYQPSEMLCPVNYKWVPAKCAQAKLQQSAPHYMCSLSDDGAVNDANVDGLNTQHQQDETLNISNIVMDVGAGIPVSIDMLQEAGQGVVRPYLEDFAREAGRQLQTQCTVKLNG